MAGMPKPSPSTRFAVFRPTPGSSRRAASSAGTAPPFSLKKMLADVFRTVRLELLKVLIYVVVVGPMFVASI